MVIAKNIHKYYGDTEVLKGVNLTIEEGEIVAIVGPSGAGKTTLMQIMAGLDKPTTGEIWFNGENVTGKEVQKRNCSMVYQQFINYPNFTKCIFYYFHISSGPIMHFLNCLYILSGLIVSRSKFEITIVIF